MNSPKNIAASVKARLQNVAGIRDIPVQEEPVRFG
jgi:hypothetical protein